MSELDNCCREYEEDLVLHYYGENSAADRQRIEQHLLGCWPCRNFIADLRRVLPGMAKAEPLPKSFWDGYYNETISKLAEQEERKHWWRRLFQPMSGWAVPALGTAAVAAIALLFVFNTNGNYSGKTAGTIPQEVLADSNKLEFFRSLDMLESLQQLEDQERDRKEPQALRSVPVYRNVNMA